MQQNCLDQLVHIAQVLKKSPVVDTHVSFNLERKKSFIPPRRSPAGSGWGRSPACILSFNRFVTKGISHPSHVRQVKDNWLLPQRPLPPPPTHQQIKIFKKTKDQKEEERTPRPGHPDKPPEQVLTAPFCRTRTSEPMHRSSKLQLANRRCAAAAVKTAPHPPPTPPKKKEKKI